MQIRALGLCTAVLACLLFAPQASANPAVPAGGALAKAAVAGEGVIFVHRGVRPHRHPHWRNRWRGDRRWRHRGWHPRRFHCHRYRDRRGRLVRYCHRGRW